ncbi:CBS domain-containing protein [Elizabethkingia sp. JS20170427COW]|uniref:CBS domain-containing protein n=1 Tax=Elizabethkingia sp. JS20170427COW TaxID=2583851 RepID=UPI00111092E5|nr:CBS domain-containing protein [Elizabethkingia sp. JS20170427COW]QCX53162.1 CBS domain-containing protein [Elizabethkingia sp. JS20170427COW]
MFIKEYISKDYPAFSITESLQKVKPLIHQSGFSHVFIQSKGRLLGAISKDKICRSDADSLEDLQPYLERFAMLEDSTILDSIRILKSFNANVIPIINSEEKYLGSISIVNIFQEFSQYPFFWENGAILIVEVDEREYSMTEIAKIVEGNNAKFYGAFIYHCDQGKIQVVVKVSRDNLSSIDETFDRFGYRVVHKFYSDLRDELLKDRLGFLQKYMEI